MSATKEARLPGRFEDLVRLQPPRAISGESSYANSTAMIDRLMTAARLTSGQAAYLETLVQLVEAYDAEHHAIESGGLTGIDSLRHLLAERGMNASDLARLLGIHVSMGSKLLNGERSLTIDHVKRLAEHFGVGAALFL